MKKYALTLLICLSIVIIPVDAQDLLKPNELVINIKKDSQHKILAALDSLFIQIDKGKLSKKFLDHDDAALTLSVLESLQGREDYKKDSIPNFYQKQLINFYATSSKKYFLSIAYMGSGENSNSLIKTIFNLIAKEENEKITFSIPLKESTKFWKTKTIGNINYHYKDTLNTIRAKKFNTKNTVIANKLGREPEKFNFYMCENYQEILKLLGFEYDLENNGRIRDGYGVDAGYIFSVMNNEDFSHDIFHYYSGKVNERKNRNWRAEEGIAYSWGNAYYTDANGEMIEQNVLVKELRNYLLQYPETSLLELFEKNINIYNHIASEVSVRSTISSLICDEIERKKGKDGILKIINAGRAPTVTEAYLNTLENLLSINRENFDKKVSQLINEFK